MNVYLVTLGKGIQGPSRMNGALFLGERSIYFLCASLGVTGGYDFSRFGAVGAALEDYKKTGTPPALTEEAVLALIPTAEHSFVLPADKLEQLSRSFCAGSKIVYDGGKKLVVWNPGFAGAFRDNAKSWAAGNGVATAGL
ncbi:MAG: hypothetical protein JNK04_16820 [Myxococcales bacterium]|nr:hypothetical protein [Myxococcales bacterium]